MKVGLIAPPWLPVPPPGYGGTEVVVDQLARGLTAAGHNVLLVATSDSTCPVETRSVFEAAQAWRIGSMHAELRHVLFAYEQMEGVDVVHDHSLMGPVLAAARGMRNVLTTNHGPFDEDVIEVYRRIHETVPIVAISQHQASTAGAVRVARVIHHGIDVERFPVGSGEGGHLLFLGRMSPDKGAHRAIRIARAVGMPLVLAGKLREPAEHRYFDAMIAPELDDEVRYVGETNEDEKLALLGAARALLNPIQWPEPFGLVMIEALACGTPVLATSEGAAPELIDDGLTGYVCDDEEQLIDAVGRLDLIDRATCRKIAEERFSTERMIAEHVELYGSIVRG